MIMLLKLQIGCFCFTVAVAIPFFMAKRAKNFTNKLFQYIILFQVISLVFDALSTYTVNNPDFTPSFLNRLFHKIFISALCVFIYFVFLYIRQLITEDNRRKRLFAYGAPLVLSTLAAFFTPLDFPESKIGNYSAGVGVTAVYCIVGVYLAMMVYFIIRYRKRIDGDKRRIIFIALLTKICFSLLQLFIPALLISSLGSTLITVAIYITIENPDRLLRELYLKEKINAEEAGKKLEEIAYTDMLTGIMNKRQFMNLTSAQVERIKRQNGSAYIIIFDIDHFKKVNDTYGHLVGDKVLKCLADRTKEQLRPYDLFARYGGEEFIMFVSDITGPDIKKHAERMRLAINGSPMEFDGLQLTVSASFGVAPVTYTDTLENIIHTADEALYKAKNEGRNRVCCAVNN